MFGTAVRRGFLFFSSLLVVACTLNPDPTAQVVEAGSPGDAATPGDAASLAELADSGDAEPRADASEPEPPEDIPRTCDDGEAMPCGPATEDGICNLGIRTCANSAWGECVDAVYPAARDCASEADNDCDGQPDYLADGPCRCQAGTTEACDAHPGLDGSGPCRAGVHACVIAADGSSSDWGPCVGAVGPNAADSCAIKGDDGNCNGTPNDICPCVEGEVYRCGPATDDGICAYGTATCAGGRIGTCTGATFPRTRDCSSDRDNDCDGRLDNTIDTACTCAVNTTEPCNTHPGLDGIGVCRAGSRRCTLGVTTTSSAFGACEGAVGASLRSCASPDDNDCNGTPDNTIDTACTCIVNQVQDCDPPPVGHTFPPCHPGLRVCVAGPASASAFSECRNAVGPVATDSCAIAGDDATCDGVPNGGCECVTGLGNAGCSTKPSASVCIAPGVCTACRLPADCALVAGLNVCSGGSCVECTATDTHACAVNEACENQVCVPRPVVADAGSGLVSAGK